MNDTNESWRKLLTSRTLKSNLISISLFLTAFEMFKERVVGLPKTFFMDINKSDEYAINEQYKKDVLSKNNSRVYASLLWLKELGAIDQADIKNFDKIRKHRNELAHNPLSFIADAGKNIDFNKFFCLTNLLCKIEKWWLVHCECLPDMYSHDAEINPDDIVTPSQWTLKLLFDMALENEPKENFYHDGFFNDIQRS